MIQSDEVVRIARVEHRVVRVSRSRDQEIHHSPTRLTTRVDDGSSEPAIAGGHPLIEGQRVEAALQDTEASQSLRPHLGRLCDQNAEMEFSQGGGTDGKLTRQRRDVCGDHDARIQETTCPFVGLAPHSAAHGSRTDPSKSSRSSAHSGSAAPENRSATSDQVLQWVGRGGTRRALGRPETVIVISSPASTRRTRPEASCLSSRIPTSLMT